MTAAAWLIRRLRVQVVDVRGDHPVQVGGILGAWDVAGGIDTGLGIGVLREVVTRERLVAVVDGQVGSVGAGLGHRSFLGVRDERDACEHANACRPAAQGVSAARQFRVWGSRGGRRLGLSSVEGDARVASDCRERCDVGDLRGCDDLSGPGRCCDARVTFVPRAIGILHLQRMATVRSSRSEQLRLAPPVWPRHPFLSVIAAIVLLGVAASALAIEGICP